jgi:hypothetical protein
VQSGKSCSSSREPEVTVVFSFISERTVHLKTLFQLQKLEPLAQNEIGR